MCASTRLLPICALVLAACSIPAVVDGTNPAPACRTDADCPASHACLDGACRWAPPDCTTDADCGPGAGCRSGTCVDLGCTTDAECGSGFHCTAGSCVPAASGCTTDTWSSYASGFFATSCLRCHAWAGAYDEVQARASATESRVAGGSMPPGGGLSSTDTDRILQWLRCGLPR